MRRNYLASSLRKFLLIFLVGSLLFKQQVQAQNWTIAVCSGGPPSSIVSNVYGPMYSVSNANTASRFAYIYPSSQLTALTGVQLTKAYFHRTTATGSMAGTPNFKIYIKEVSAVDWGVPALDWATAITGATLVYDGNPAAIVGTAAGWKAFPFTTNFSYSGTQNLAVFTEYTNATASTNLTWSFEQTSPCVNTANSNTTKYAEVTTGALPTSLATANYRRPYIGFDFIVPPCTSPPTAGAATINPSAPVCMGIPLTLSLSGNSFGSSQTYQWESSANIAGPYTAISGLLSTPTFNTTSPASTVYYRAAVTCSGNTTYSTPVQGMVNTPMAGGTYTINSALPTGGTNFTSFTHAVAALSCGINGPITFNVDPASGPYNEQIIINAIPGSSSTNTVSFNGNGTTIQYLSTNTNERAVIKLNGASHVSFDSLNITALGSGASDYGFGVQLINNADSNSFNRCTININTSSTATNFAGIVINAAATGATSTGATLCDYNSFTNNTVNGGYYSMTLVGSSTNAVGNNKFVNNKFLDFYFYGNYIQFAFNTLVEGNIYSRPTRANVSTFIGVYLPGLCTKTNITRNRFSDGFDGAPTNTNPFYGVYFSACDAVPTLENVVTNNLINNATGAGDFYGFYNSTSDNVWYFHNTISLEGTGVGTSNLNFTRGFYQISQAAGIQFKNNIISITRGGLSTKTAIYFSTPTSDIVSNKNDFYLNATGTAADVGFYNLALHTLSNWQGGSSQDANSFASDPLFTDVTVGNYKPNTTAIDNVGAPLNILVDINNDPRSATTPDIGAYEFTPPPCTTPPNAGAATAGVNPACINSAVQIRLTGNSIGIGQTYQWQSSTSAAGPFTNLGNVLTIADTVVYATSNIYYRAAVTCSGITSYSAPFLLAVTPTLPAGNYTIDQTAPASATNYTSFNAAKDALHCGIDGPVIFSVVPGSGPYNEQVLFDSIPGTSPTKTVTFKGNGETIAFNSQNTNERAVIKLFGTDFVTFDSLVVDASVGTSMGFGIQLMNNADSNRIVNCTINAGVNATTTSYAGIVIDASATTPFGSGFTLCDGNVIDNNTVIGGYYGITSVASSTSFNYNNVITRNRIRDVYGYPIYLLGNKNCLVEGNDISTPTRTTNQTHYGIYVTGYAQSNYISKNRIHNPFDGTLTNTSSFYGIYFGGVLGGSPGLENVVSNNVIYNLFGAGTFYGYYSSATDNTHYFHNTMTADYSTASTSTTIGLYITSSGNGLVFKNNIINITRAGTGTKYGIFIGSSGINYTSNNNDIYLNAASANTGYNNGTTLLTLTNWQTTTGQDANSIAVDPFFNNVANGDLQPTNALADNKGVPAGIATDILNATRSSSVPDIGAWEFNVLPCTTPPTPGTANATPNAGICLGVNVRLTLTGNSVGAGQSYQWQYSTASTGPWTSLGNVMTQPDTTIQSAGTFYYRVAVSCSGNTVYSVPTLVNNNPLFAAGTYTIDNTQPTSGTNFNSFTDAVASLDCGIAGPIIFNVAPGTYTEQIRMHPIAGSSSVNTVTFQSANGNASSVTLTYAPTVTNGYVLKLDSASNIIYKNMSIVATGSGYARGIELAYGASNDSLLNLTITVPPTLSTSNLISGIVASTLSGTGVVIKGNTITGGSYGMYLSATATFQPNNFLIDSNTLSNNYYYGIYLNTINRVTVSRNTVSEGDPRNSTGHGIYGGNCDDNYQFVGNVININNATNATTYGMYLSGCDASPAQPGRIANNKIIALTNNTGGIYGLFQASNSNNNTVNNVIVINTTGALSYGIYNSGGGPINYYNNSVNSLVVTPATTNYAAYFSNNNGNGVDVRNNIFSHKGGGIAMFVAATSYVYSDYNLLYTTGPTLVQAGLPGVNYASLAAWKAATTSDVNSMVYQPAFNSNSNLTPNLADPNVWAMHGRGVQIAGNNYDFSNNPRPTTLTAGVPDLGAYEFLPTSTPPVLTATPANPAPGITQTFMFGTDTVSKITWKPGSVVPSSVSVRRYSGVAAPNLPATAKYMYFYTDVDLTTSTAPQYDYQQYYLDPWQGFISREPLIRLGRNNAAGNWIMDPVSRVDTVSNIIGRDTLSYADKFTGLTDSTIALPPQIPTYVQDLDTSNRGRRFWVAYGHHYDFNTNNQDMVLYLSADQAAHVTVKVNGTTWQRNYSIPANTAIVSDIMPKAGLFDAKITDEGKFTRGISIESDVPIVAYAHIYNGSNSGAGMLLPVGVYGYEYTTLNSKQHYPAGAAGAYSWFYVIADHDSTQVEITPSVLTKAGRPANVPFTVYLNRGEVYNVMGTITGDDGTDLSGSRVKSIPNASGNCYPIAVFSGSSRTAICYSSNGDNIMQQVFPNQAWGKRYLAFSTAASGTNSVYYSNMYRVMVKDPTTVVKENGTIIPSSQLVVPGNYYEFGINQGTGPNTSVYIEADKPVMVGQYMISTSADQCGLTPPGGDGDPELIYISPIEQGIKKAIFYNTNKYQINENYVNVIVPTAGLSSLKIDGSSTFTDVFAHPYLAGYTCVRQNLPVTPGQHTVQCDSAFSAITYGLGSVESYGYNAGTLVKNLNAIGAITNVFSPAGTINSYTCKGTPVRFKIQLNVKPTNLVWHFSLVPNLSPNADSIQVNPVPVDSTMINGVWFYTFVINQNFVFSTPGNYGLPITITHASFEGCNNSVDYGMPVQVLASPLVDYTYSFSGCVNDIAQFNGAATTNTGMPLSQWNWNFGDATTSTLQNPTKQWATPATYNVLMKGIATDGCVSDTTKQIAVAAQPIVNIVPDSLSSCAGAGILFSVQNPGAGVTYNWYTAAAGGSIVHTGTSYTFTVNGPVSYYVEAVTANGCKSATRKKITVTILPNLATPVITLDSASTSMLRFKWNAIAGATGYQVSTDNGGTWVNPSSGAAGLTHTITGLQPLQTVTLLVRALGGCAEARSLPFIGKALTDQVFIPNSFSPNGDGRNDALLVYGYIIKEMHFMIFNQWGENIFESRNQNIGWDGNYKGKPQPSGVYIYVCDMILNDGSKLQKKGSINLVR